MSQSFGSSATLTQASLAELRHDLRTPVNHVIGYAEMLAEDATGPSLVGRRAHLADTLGAARDILALINSTLGLHGASVSAGDVTRLYEALRQPRHRIVSAVTAVLRSPEAEQDSTLADDLGRGEYSDFGTKDIRTPHIDRLCHEGLTFDNFYANSCVCSPSRAALLTGCFPHRVGVPGVIREEEPDSNWGWLSQRAKLFPQLLRPAGRVADGC